MNKFDDLYEFRLATLDDVENIMGFIRDEWKENHILAHDRELFLWQYGNTEYGDSFSINVVLMENKNKDIVGMIGFVPYSNDKNRLHISTAITKISSKVLIPLAGVELMKRQTQLVGENVNFASGANPKTIVPIFKAVFRHEVGVMQQYYMLSPECRKFCVAKITEKPTEECVDAGFRLEEFNLFDDIVDEFDFNRDYGHMSFKSKEFLNKRYFEHPIYSYKKWMLKDGTSKTVGLLFGREIEACGGKVLRLVDYRGELENLWAIGNGMKELMIEKGYEYVDLMVSPLPAWVMEHSGFSLLDLNGMNIIPNYFEPFLQENIKVYYQKSADIVIFKADGDQDRPNKRM